MRVALVCAAVVLGVAAVIALLNTEFSTATALTMIASGALLLARNMINSECVPVLRSTVVQIVRAYVIVGALLGTIMWGSYFLRAAWSTSPRASLARQAVEVLLMQHLAVFAGTVRAALWGPSLALWFVAPNGYPFGMWLAPGLYSETGDRR